MKWYVWHQVSGGHDAPVARIYANVLSDKKAGDLAASPTRRDAIETALSWAEQAAYEGQSVQVNIGKER